MRTNIDIDDRLIAEAMRASGARTKKAVVEQALKLLLQLKGQEDAIREMAGLGWEGDLDARREDQVQPRP